MLLEWPFFHIELNGESLEVLGVMFPSQCYDHVVIDMVAQFNVAAVGFPLAKVAPFFVDYLEAFF